MEGRTATVRQGEVQEGIGLLVAALDEGGAFMEARSSRPEHSFEDKLTARVWALAAWSARSAIHTRAPHGWRSSRCSQDSGSARDQLRDWRSTDGDREDVRRELGIRAVRAQHSEDALDAMIEEIKRYQKELS